MRKNVAIITGATGGIGKEFVSLMIDKDVDEIWCAARNQDKLRRLKTEYGEKIHVIALDLSKQESITEFIELIKKESINVTYLINNAGIGEKLGSYKELNAKKSYETIQVNCTAVAAICVSLYAIIYIAFINPIYGVIQLFVALAIPFICLFAV